MDYIEVDCKVNPGGDNIDILIAYLAGIGYSMFQENEAGVKAYIDVTLFDQNALDDLPFIKEPNQVDIQYVVRVAEKRNWNQEWESSFQPVIIGNEVYVRAEYHLPDPSAKYELVIQPRMAFGTGHHATTSLMMEAMLKIDFKHRHVLDMGCGTAILAILAEKMGANSITAIDNDPVATENAVVNCEINGVKNVSVVTGNAATPGNEIFDVILANINRNIILEDITLYAKNLAKEGILMLSGFYLADLEKITGKAASLNLKCTSHQVLNGWCQANFTRI